VGIPGEAFLQRYFAGRASGVSAAAEIHLARSSCCGLLPGREQRRTAPSRVESMRCAVRCQEQGKWGTKTDGGTLYRLVSFLRSDRLRLSCQVDGSRNRLRCAHRYIHLSCKPADPRKNLHELRISVVHQSSNILYYCQRLEPEALEARGGTLPQAASFHVFCSSSGSLSF